MYVRHYVSFEKTKLTVPVIKELMYNEERQIEQRLYFQAMCSRSVMYLV